MAYGPTTVYNLVTTDMIAPGMPTFVSAIQVNNTVIRLVLAIPVMDADGGNLTGLTKLTVVTKAMVNDNPFENKGMVDCIAVPGAMKFDIALTPSDAGVQKTVEVPVMNLGGAQAFAAACADADD